MPRHKQAGDGGLGRAVWSGTLSFGLVSMPVAVFPANREKRVSLHLVSPDGTRLERRYFSESGDKPLDDRDLVHGIEVKKGKSKRAKQKMVVLDDDELARIAPERTRDIGLEAFVKVDDIDPMYFDRAYYLAPTGPSNQAYRLLAQVMEDTGRAGVAKFVMRAKEHLAAIIAERGILRLETLHFADELRSPKEVGLPKPSHPRGASVMKLEQQVRRHTKSRFNRKELEDKSALRLVHLADRKRRAHEDVVKVPRQREEEADPDVIDLMSRLRQSVQGTSTRKHRRRSR